MTPIQLFLACIAAGAVVGPALMLALSVQLSMRKLRRRAIWEDDATAWGKARTYLWYAYDDHTLNREFAKALGMFVAGGAGAGAVIAVLALGVAQLIGPRRTLGAFGAGLTLIIIELFRR